MVLAELRALANQVGVKGTSGMRKNELIAAIREIRGQANGTAPAEAPAPTASTAAPVAQEAPAAQGEQGDSSAEAPRRERRSASREAGTATREGTAETDNRRASQ